MLRLIGGAVVLIVLVICAGALGTPKSSWRTADAPPSGAEYEAKKAETIHAAAQHEREGQIAHCMGPGADVLPSKVYAAMSRECERRGAASASDDDLVERISKAREAEMEAQAAAVAAEAAAEPQVTGRPG